MTKFKNSILAGLAFAVLFGSYLAFVYDLRFALIGGSIAGLLFGLCIHLFTNSKTVQRQTEINESGETIIHSGPANHFVGMEAVGGKLYLLADKLVFQSHGFNVQNHRLEITMDRIREVGFHNMMGIIPTGMIVKTSDGGTEKFVLSKRSVWKTKIEEQRK
jgi:hypothetical protein